MQPMQPMSLMNHGITLLRPHTRSSFLISSEAAKHIEEMGINKVNVPYQCLPIASVKERFGCGRLAASFRTVDRELREN